MTAFASGYYLARSQSAAGVPIPFRVCKLAIILRKLNPACYTLTKGVRSEVSMETLQ